MTRIEPASTAVTRTSSSEKSRSPSWNAVCGWRSPSCSAIAPNSVRPPVRTTTPSPLPSRTTVPMNAHEARSREDSGAAMGSLRFSAGSDSPVSTASSHSSPSACSRRRSAGTTSPTASRTTSPGHELGDVDRRGLAVAHRQRGVAQLGVQRLDRQLGAVLVEEPQPDAEADDQQDDQRAGALTDGKRGQRRGHEQDQQRIAQLTRQHRERPRAMAAQRVGPNLGQPRRRLVARKAGGGARPGARGPRRRAAPRPPRA